MGRIIVVLFLSASLLSAGGCASIVSNSEWPVMVTSRPTGAVLTVTDTKGETIQKTTTPALLMLKSGNGYFRSANYILQFEKEGHRPERTVLSGRLNGWYWGNLILGGVIGMLIVDPGTGAMWRLDERVVGSLAEAPAAAEAAVTVQDAGGEMQAPAAAEQGTAAPEIPSTQVPAQQQTGYSETSAPGTGGAGARD